MVDSDYRGNISVILTNSLSENVIVGLGEKTVQIMFVRPETVSFEEVSDCCDTTIRGSRGFGSTST